MPTHIVVNKLGLTYKGTIGISIATIPDVCKTPTPGGPVPMPYPNIANQGTLKDGTTTVFAKGGKMIAIKGSQYGMSTGDEPGTVGGVKSNVFKKATDWITYSFDVKMDGKNACRHTDKKFHNDKNTVDLAGDLDAAPPTTAFELSIDCDQKMNRPESGMAKDKWSNCQCQQYCKKVEHLNKARLANGGSLEKVDYDKNDYRNYKSQYKTRFRQRVRNGQGVRRQFIHKCAADEWEKSGSPENPCEKGPGGTPAPFNADHLHDAQYGGPLDDFSNFRMLDGNVNVCVGPAMTGYHPDGEHKGKPIKANDNCNCPHGPTGP